MAILKAKLILDAQEFLKSLTGALKGGQTQVENEGKESGKKFGLGFSDSVSNVLVKGALFNQVTQLAQTIGGALQSISAPFTELDTATQTMRTLGKEAQSMSAELRTVSIQMSTELPFSAGEFQSAMADAMASGVGGGVEGLSKFAETAAKLATGGGASLGDVVKGLGATLNAFGATSMESAKYADYLFNTVNAGVTTIGELNQYLSGVTPTAASMGLAFDKVGGSLALMTQKGVPTAAAVTKLNAMLIEFAKPSAGVKAALDAAGVSIGDFQQKIKDDDLVGALQTLDGGFKKLGKSATESFSSSEAGAAFNVLMGDVGLLQDTLDAVSNTTGSTEEAYAQMADSVEVKTKQMDAIFKSFLIKVVDATGGLGGYAIAFVNTFSQIAPQITALASLKSIFSDIAAPIGNLAKDLITKLVPSLFTTITTTTATGAAATTTAFSFSALWTAITGPIGLVIAGIVAVGGAFYLLYKNSEGFRNFIDSLWQSIKELGTAVWDYLKPIFSSVGGFISDLFRSIGTVFTDFWNNSKPILATIGTSLTGAFTTLGSALGWLWDVLKPIGEFIGTVFVTYWKTLYEGLKIVIGILFNFGTFLAQNIFPILKNVGELILNVIVGAFTGLWSAIKNVYDVIAPFATIIGAVLIAPFYGFYAIVKEVVTWIIKNFDAIKAVFFSIGEFIKNFVIERFNMLKNGIVAVYEFVSNFFVAVWNRVIEALTNLFNFVANIFNPVWNALKKAFESVYNFIANVFLSVWGRLTDAFNFVKGIVINMLAPFKLLIDTFKKAATIGDYLKAILAGIGEAFGVFRTALSDLWDGIINLDFKKIISSIAGLGEKMTNAAREGMNKSIALSDKQRQDELNKEKAALAAQSKQNQKNNQQKVADNKQANEQIVADQQKADEKKAENAKKAAKAEKKDILEVIELKKKSLEQSVKFNKEDQKEVETAGAKLAIQQKIVGSYSEFKTVLDEFTKKYNLKISERGEILNEDIKLTKTQFNTAKKLYKEFTDYAKKNYVELDKEGNLVNIDNKATQDQLNKAKSLIDKFNDYATQNKVSVLDGEIVSSGAKLTKDQLNKAKDIIADFYANVKQEQKELGNLTIDASLEPFVNKEKARQEISDWEKNNIAKLEVQVELGEATKLDLELDKFINLKNEEKRISEAFGDIDTQLTLELDEKKREELLKRKRDLELKKIQIVRDISKQELILDNETQKTIITENLKGKEQQRELELLDLKIKYEAELQSAKDQKLSLLDIELKYQDDRKKIVDKYKSDTTSELATFSGLAREMSKSYISSLGTLTFDFSGDEAKRKERLTSIEKSIEDEKNAYKKGTKSYSDYVQSVQKLEDEKADILKNGTDKFAKVLDGFNNVLAASFKNTLEVYKNLADENFKAIQKANERAKNAEERMQELRLSGASESSESFKELEIEKAESSEEAQNRIKMAYVLTAVQIGASMGQALAEGKSVLKAFVVAALDALQTFIPIISAQILALSLATPESIATWTTAGLAQFAIVTTLLSAAVQTAKASVQSMKFAKGGLNPYGGFGGGLVDKETTITRVTVGEAGSEYVVNHEATKKNFELLEHINSGKDPLLLLKDRIIFNDSNIVGQISQTNSKIDELNKTLKVARKIEYYDNTAKPLIIEGRVNRSVLHRG